VSPRISRPLQTELTKHTIIVTLRANPDWPVLDLKSRIGGDPEHARLLGEVTIGELRKEPPALQLLRAQATYGAAFDDLMLVVLREAARPVQAHYLRARLGGPRWKLQASLQRLIAAELADRSGATCSTRYWARSS
jgi:hypothetical protein